MIIGSYFGEIEIIFKTKRCHTTVAAEQTDLLTLSKQIYENIIVKDFFEIHEEIKFIAGVRLEKNMEAEKFLNQTLANSKEKRKKRTFFHNKENYFYKVLLDLKKFKRHLDSNNYYKRSNSYDCINKEKQLIPSLLDKFFQIKSLNKENEMNIHYKKSLQAVDVYSKEGLTQKLNENFDHSKNKSQSKKNIFNWSSDSDNDASMIKNEETKVISPSSRKLAFYNKLISANKKNQNARRPSFILEQIVQRKVLNNDLENNAIKEESSEKSYTNSENRSNYDENSENEENIALKMNSETYTNKRKSIDIPNETMLKNYNPLKMSSRNIKRQMTVGINQDGSKNNMLLLKNMQSSTLKNKKSITSNEASKIAMKLKSSSNAPNLNLKIKNIMDNNKIEINEKRSSGQILPSMEIEKNINDFCDSQKITIENLSKIVGDLKNTVKELK